MKNKKLKLRTKQVCVLVKYVFYVLYCRLRKVNNSSVWLISERGNEARDNGFAFYKYMLKNHPEIDFRFIITKDSPDLKKFSNKDRIVYYGSKEHYILFLTSGYHLSTHIMGCSPEFRIFRRLDKRKLISIPAKRIFLNHGIESSNIDVLNKTNMRIDLFVCTAKPQYEYEVRYLGHPVGVVQQLGMPRYDYLKNNLKKQIVVMPTWRMWLFYCKGIKEFKESEYYQCWNNLLKSDKLHKLLDEYDVRLVFYPHYEIQPYIDAFSDKYGKRIVIADFEHYDVQALLNESRLMITDFSSVHFDFAYLRKPIVYYQFDKKRFEEDHYGKGYFEWDRDSFGPIEENIECVIMQLEQYLRNNFVVEHKYRRNRDRFFTLPDGGNCERVYQQILKTKNHFWK